MMRPKSKAPDGKTPLPAVVPNGNKAKMAWSGVAAGKVVTSVPTETKKLSFASAATTTPRKFKKRDLEEPEDLRSDVGSGLLAENSEPVPPESLGDLASPLLPNHGGQRFSAEDMLAVWRNMKDKNVLVKTEVNNQSMYQSIHLNTPSLLQKDQGAGGSLMSKDREGWSPFKSVSVVSSVESPSQGHQSLHQPQQQQAQQQQAQHQHQQQYQADPSAPSSAAMSPTTGTVPSVFDTFNAPAVPPGMGFTASPPKLQHPENIKWMYKDYQGIIQGPFAGPVMHTWWKGGHLDAKLLIRREDDDVWQTVDELISKTSTQEPFLTPLPFVAKQPPVINTQTAFSQQYQQPGVPQQQQQQQQLHGQQQQQGTPQQGGSFQGSTSSFQHYPQHLHGSVSSWGSPAVTPMSPTPWGGSQMGGQATPNNNFGGGGSFFDQPFHGGHSQSSFFDDRSMWRSGSVSNTMSPALSRASSVIFPNDGPHTPTRAGSHTPLAAAASTADVTAADNELLELDSLPLHLKDVIGDDLEEVPTIKEEEPEKKEMKDEGKKDVEPKKEAKEEPEEPLTAKERAKRERDAAKKEKKRKEKEEKQRIKEKMAAEKAERLEREAREKAEKARLEQLRIEQEAIDREEAKKAEAEKAERARRIEEERLAKEAREKEAPWTAKENKKKEKPNKMSLAEIQQLEEFERQKKEAEEKELANAIRAIEEAELQQENSLSASRDEPSFKPTWATAPVASAPAKSLSQIQKEEEAARKKNTITSATAVSSGGVKKYADVLPRRAPVPAAAAVPDAASPWTTVGAHGKRMGEDGMPVRAQTPTAPAAHMAHQYAAQQAAAAQQQAALAARPSAPVAPAAPKVLTPAESFLQWCHGALRGLNAGVNETELIGMLMTLPAEEESTEIIADIVYANSSTLDGRRFAAEFLKRRKIADGDSAVKWSEVIQHAEVAPQDDGWNTAFKVVGKKKRAP
ncbi:Conserved hypothetical protein [Yarrowia lipolytica]|nr:Conserved hypothetical protein [Yarrowia lipolytica]